jgi:hypothetical protein
MHDGVAGLLGSWVAGLEMIWQSADHLVERDLRIRCWSLVFFSVNQAMAAVTFDC